MPLNPNLPADQLKRAQDYIDQLKQVKGLVSQLASIPPGDKAVSGYVEGLIENQIKLIENDSNSPNQFPTSFEMTHQAFASSLNQALSESGINAARSESSEQSTKRAQLTNYLNNQMDELEDLSSKNPRIRLTEAGASTSRRITNAFGSLTRAAGKLAKDKFSPKQEQPFFTADEQAQGETGDLKATFFTPDEEGGQTVELDASERPRAGSTASSSGSTTYPGANAEKLQRYENVALFFEAMADRIENVEKFRNKFTKEEGIFRLAGTNTKIDEGIEDIKQGKMNIDDYPNPHDLSNMMKRIMQKTQEKVGIEALEFSENKPKDLQDWVSRPEVTEYHCRVLGAFASILPHILNKTDENKMTEQNLGITADMAIGDWTGTSPSTEEMMSNKAAKPAINLSTFTGENEANAAYLRTTAADWKRDENETADSMKTPPAGETEKKGKSKFGSLRGKFKSGGGSSS